VISSLYQTMSATLDDGILFLAPDFGPDRTGGVQLSARIAWERLQSTGGPDANRNQLFCFSKQTEQYHRLKKHYAKLATVNHALYQQWSQHCMLVWHIGLLKLLPFFRLASAKVILFLHGIEVWRCHDPITRLLLPRINLFLSNSSYTWQHFLDYYPYLSTRLHQTVHLGLDGAERIRFPASALQREHDDPQALAGHQVVNIEQSQVVPVTVPAALVLSRLSCSEDYKGHRELIAAWPLLLQRVPNARLWIAGDGDLRPELEQLVARHGLTEHIHFFGQVSEERKQELLVRCRCFTMPSRGEGFGLVYLEAMRLGRPCLVSDCDAGREVVNPPEAGLAVNPDDRLALVVALERLLTPGTEWENWSAQAQQRYASRFTAMHFQERLLKALEL
jgi:phosphatidylinositol alpha-1,6-mannosyltransferase